MAALLRSARLLRFTPPGLLQIAWTKVSGPPLGRLYSGALAGARSGVCGRRISPALWDAHSRVRPYVVGCVRNYSVATEQKDDASTGVQFKQAQDFDWALTKLDSSVRRTGRITKTLLLRIFHDICRTGYPSGNQALLLLRSCGSLLPEVPLEERTELAHSVWDKLQELGAQYDVSHYNALLKVYLQNEFKFSPTDYLAKMEAANIQPNRVTYQRLIAAYCHNGDIEGASTILGFMKSKDLPITEAVFNSLVTGHARAGDIESAKNILTVMGTAGIEPGADTYVSLLNAYAEKGDLDVLKKTLEEAESADCSLMDRDILQVIYTLAMAGHQQLVPELIERLRHERGFLPDAMNFCLRLLTEGKEDIAFHILKTSLQSVNFRTESPDLGSFFLRHCVNMETSLEKLDRYCKELQALKLHSGPLTFTLSCALASKKSGMSVELMKLMKKQDLPLRPHYFWPLLAQHMKDNNQAGVIEVLKVMQELGVPPDTETISRYTLPAFTNIKEAQQALQDAGVQLNSGLFSSEIRMVARNNLAELYSLLSDPSHSSLDLGLFRNSLIMGFKKSDDVESMVKITKLLYEDGRFYKDGAKPTVESASFLFYHLMDNMTGEEVQEQEEKLRKYFNQLQAQNITITVNIFRGIKKLLEAYEVPELIEDVMALVDTQHPDTHDVLPAAPRVNRIEGNVLSLEKKLAELKAANSPVGNIPKSLVQALCVEENLQRALELKQQYEEEMTIGSNVMLMNLCCRLDNAEEALNLKREISRKDPSVRLDVSKYIALVRAFSMNDMVEDAMDILKEMKEKDVKLNDVHTSMLSRALNALADTGNFSAIQRLQDTIFTLGLAKPTGLMCSPLVLAHLNKQDLSGALDAALECHNRYNQIPRFHDIIVALVEKGDTELLQKALDLVSEKRGEMTTLYDLLFGFLHTGRYREARKIIETPGMRAKPGRLHWYAEKCIATNQMEALEEMVNMTAKLFECDRDEMYSYVLRLCQKTNNWQKAETMWMKMQEENLIPRERTLQLLADILKTNGQEVPFEVPETWYKKAEMIQTETKFSPADGSSEHRDRILALFKAGRSQEAYSLLKDTNEKGVSLSYTAYDHLIRSLLAGGSLEDAMAIKDIAVAHFPDFEMSGTANSLLIITQSMKGLSKDALEKLKYMLSKDKVPSSLAVSRLVYALSRDGDLAGIQDVESLMKDFSTSLNLSRMLFTNSRALALIKNGDVEMAVENLEEVFTRPDGKNLNAAHVFRKVLEEDNDKALDKLSAMAERLANHFACYRPAADLFIELLHVDKVEEAKFMLARCNAVAEQKRLLLNYMSRKAAAKQLDKIKTLVSLIPDLTENEELYSNLMKCHYLNKDLTSAKALYQQMQEEGRVLDELALKRLALLYRREGLEVPFTEPPGSLRFYAVKPRQKDTESQTKAEE